jgi:DTW domain-containing protein YfiP
MEAVGFLNRPLCVRCLRAKAVCLCAGIRSFSPFFQVVLLQHPKERKNSIGTARFTHLTLSNSRLIAGSEFETDPAVNLLLGDAENYCVVLFPGPSSVNISDHRDEFVSSIPAKVDGTPRRLVVFVIDGTWAHAKGMIRRSLRLAELPRISFTVSEPSNYRVRKQPHEYCLSTVEAVAKLVKILDPRMPAESLIETFGKMVEWQIECASRANLRAERHADKSAVKNA